MIADVSVSSLLEEFAESNFTLESAYDFMATMFAQSDPSDIVKLLVYVNGNEREFMALMLGAQLGFQLGRKAVVGS